ncbi:tektin-B1 isoform X3 [Cryptotermes secundus]|uniref:tektin-B1 isoform X3 n=1 Tax=Cryptotermes secundus TaxID=105785 RepID=UPI000CD7B90B|nr:tektin-B1 isoform X3 [Cryptotermes secundus]
MSNNRTGMDWYARTWQMRQIADTQQSASFNLRADGRQLRNETALRTKWDTYHNDARLHDRFTEVSQWQDVLEQCLQAVENEIAKLTEEKCATERELESLTLQLNTVAECIRQRDSRYGNDLVLSDEGDSELKNELGVIEHLKAFLTNKCQTAWEQINRLKEVQFSLQLDISNKKAAVAIDKENFEMTEDCSGTSYKPDPLRIPKNSIAHEAWLEHSQYKKLKADNELAASGRLREAMYWSREKAHNDLQAQHDATDYGLRRCIYETQRQKNELQWQRQKMMNEMEKMSKEIADLEHALMDKTNSAKLAETRLENRLYRPGAELVQDEAHFGLRDEVLQLRQTQQDLRKKIDDGKATYNDLEEHLIRLDQDIANKQHTLMTDLRCMDMRDVLKKGDLAPPATQTQRNIQLTQIEEELPKF